MKTPSLVSVIGQLAHVIVNADMYRRLKLELELENVSQSQHREGSRNVEVWDRGVGRSRCRFFVWGRIR